MNAKMVTAGIGTPDALKGACPVWGGLGGDRLQRYGASILLHRPDIAIGHVRLLVGNVAKTTDFFVNLGIRTIVEHADFAVLELRGGTHLVLRTWEDPEGGPVPFDIMVDDIDAAYRRIQGHGMDVTDITRGRIHDHFEVQTPDRRALTINSSHAGDRAV